jgi:murein DD-endopeptidase MepM/ murein hydrolase activator NlpD
MMHTAVTRMKRTAPILILLASLSTVAIACEKSTQVVLTAEKKATGSDILITTKDLLDATIDLEVNLNNMSASRPSKSTFDLSEYADRAQPYRAVTVKQAGPGAFGYSFYYHYNLGNRGGTPDSTIYELPFARGEQHRVSQGWMGKFSHGAGTRSEYAVDFLMPTGTTVCAARGGVVAGLRSDSNEGGPDESFEDCANYVLIRHSDGTYAEYAHLEENGVAVRLGDEVSAGQVLGTSGQTGRATDPHLHFAVFTPIDSYKRKTYPTKFNSAGGVVDKIEEGQTYGR